MKSFLYIDMTKVPEIIPHGRQVPILDIMGADVLETKGAKASATKILTMLNCNNLVPAC